jgi:hypothetical protein
MHMRFRIRQAVLPMLFSEILLKFACQAAVLPSVLLCVRHYNIK